MGYITTPEEYDIQAYEGGHTIYGRRTLDAFILIVTQLTLKLHNMNHHEIPLVKSFSFPNDELEKRSQR
jgi:neutral ceramidase